MFQHEGTNWFMFKLAHSDTLSFNALLLLLLFEIFKQSVQWVWIVWNCIVQKQYYRISRVSCSLEPKTMKFDRNSPWVNLQFPNENSKWKKEIVKEKALSFTIRIESGIDHFRFFSNLFGFSVCRSIETHFVWTIIGRTFNR